MRDMSMLPPIRKLVVSEDNLGAYTSVEMLEDVFHVLDTGLLGDQKLELLKFQPYIHCKELYGKNTSILGQTILTTWAG